MACVAPLFLLCARWRAFPRGEMRAAARYARSPRCTARPLNWDARPAPLQVVDGPGVGANVDAGALPREIADHSPLIRCVRTMGASSSRAPRVALSFERGGTPWTVRAPVARVRCAENATAPLPSWIAHSDPSSRPDAGAAVGSLAALHIPGLVHALGQTVNIYHEYDQGPHSSAHARAHAMRVPGAEWPLPLAGRAAAARGVRAQSSTMWRPSRLWRHGVRTCARTRTRPTRSSSPPTRAG